MDQDNERRSSRLLVGVVSLLALFAATPAAASAQVRLNGGGLDPYGEFGDFTGDGKIDRIDPQTNETFQVGDGSGGFSAPQPVTGLESAHVSAVGDADQDGYDDVIDTNFDRSNEKFSATAYASDGSGGFDALDAPGIGAAEGAVSDLNSDGAPDVIASSDGGLPPKLGVLLNAGDGTFADADPLALPLPAGGSSLSTPQTGDFNGDGDADIAVCINDGFSSGSEDPRLLDVLLGDGDGGFHPSAQTPIQLDGNCGAPAVGDFDSDGFDDVVTAGENAPLLGSPDGNLEQGEQQPWDHVVGEPVAARIDDDETLDLLLDSYRPGDGLNDRFAVWLGDGDGSFSTGPGLRYGRAALKAPTKAITLEPGGLPGFVGRDSIWANTTLQDPPPPETTLFATNATQYVNTNPVYVGSNTDDDSASVECSVDFGPWADCDDGYLAVALEDGEYSVRGRAVTPTSSDPTPAMSGFVLDTLAPEPSARRTGRRVDGFPVFRIADLAPAGSSHETTLTLRSETFPFNEVAIPRFAPGPYLKDVGRRFEREFTLVVTMEDQAGNRASKTVTFRGKKPRR